MEFIDGVNVITELVSDVRIPPLHVILFFIISLIIFITSCILLGIELNDKKHTEFLSLLCCVIIFGFCTIMLGESIKNDYVFKKTQYYITIDDSVNAKDFLATYPEYERVGDMFLITNYERVDKDEIN